MMDRMVRTAKLDPVAYEEVERDREATTQALLVVLLVAVASAVGAGLTGSIGALILAPIAAIIGWLLFAGIAYWVGTTFLAGTQTRASLGELLRTTGFAQSPGILRILGFVPVLGVIITIVVAIWILIAVVIAVRQALDFDTGRAIVTSLIAWVIQTVLFIVIYAVLV